MIVSPKNLWTGLGFDGALSLVALGVLLAAGFQLTATLVVALVLSFFLIRNLGQALAPDYDGGQVTSISASFVLGFAALSMAMMALVMTFSVTAFGALLWCIPAIALVMFARRTRLMAERSTSWLEAAAVLVFGATTAWLCRWQITAYASLLDSNVLHPWADFFVHGAQVAQFGDPLAAHRGDILEVGRPLAFYHYGMFMLPAALLAVSGALPGLAIATSALLVLGLLVGMLGCFALALELGGGLAGLVAVAAMMLLPDAAALWPGNGLFGFHWLLMTAPGSGYAVGVSAVALLFLTRWLRRARWQDALCCALLVASVALLRAQIFVVLAPACVAVAVCTRFSARAKPVAACVAAAMLLLAMASIFLHPFQGWFQARTRFTEFINFAYLVSLPDSLAQPYADLARLSGAVCASWIGLLLLPILMLGPWIVLAPLVVINLHRRRLLSQSDLIPLMLMLAYLAAVVFAPTPSNSDFTEFKHRPFVLVYAIFMIWPIARFCGTVELTEKIRTSIGFGWGATLIFCVIGASTLLLRDYDPQVNPALWTKHFVDTRQPIGLGDAAAFIRMHARPGDVMTSIGSCEDHSVALASMTDMPQYFARGGVQWSRRDREGPDLDPHAQVMRTLESGDSAGDLAPVLNHAKINWLVVINPEPGCEVHGPKSGVPVFQSQQVAVFAPLR